MKILLHNQQNEFRDSMSHTILSYSYKRVAYFPYQHIPYGQVRVQSAFERQVLLREKWQTGVQYDRSRRVQTAKVEIDQLSRQQRVVYQLRAVGIYEWREVLQLLRMG